MIIGSEPTWSSENTLQAEEVLTMNTARWPLAKYASYTSKNVWKERETNDQDLWIQITETNQIQIVHGHCLLESFSPLQDSSCSVRGAYRGPVLLLTSSCNDVTRKCRVRFAQYRNVGAEDMRAKCTEQLAKLILLRDLDSPQDDPTIDAATTTLSGTAPLNQIAKALLYPKTCQWPPSYKNLVQEKEKIKGLVRCCLMDPSFPELVERVESILRDMTIAEDNA